MSLPAHISTNQTHATENQSHGEKTPNQGVRILGHEPDDVMWQPPLRTSESPSFTKGSTPRECVGSCHSEGVSIDVPW